MTGLKAATVFKSNLCNHSDLSLNEQLNLIISKTTQIPYV